MKKIKATLLRDKDILTGSKNLEQLYKLPDFPVFIGATSEPEMDDVFADMIVDISKDSGLIQLRNLLPLDLIYSGYHSEALGGVWKTHHQKFANLIAEYKIDNILEIGGSNGSLAELVYEIYPYQQWIMVEPNPAVENSEKITVIKDIFDENFKLGNKKINGVVHSHTLEHLYDPENCLKKIYSLLNVGDKHIFSIPNLYKWLESGFPNTINFEHTYFLTEDFMDILIQNYGFKILKKEYHKEHSIFYVTEKMEKTLLLKFPNYYEEYRQLYLKFIKQNADEVEKLNQFIDTFDGAVYLFGGHIFSQFLIHLGLDEQNIVAILDNSVAKQNKRLYGTILSIASPDVLKAQKGQVAVILRAGAYTQEITEQLKKINKNVEILS